MVAKGQMGKGRINNDKVQQMETITVIMSLTYLSYHNYIYMQLKFTF